MATNGTVQCAAIQTEKSEYEFVPILSLLIVCDAGDADALPAIVCVLYRRIHITV